MCFIAALRQVSNCSKIVARRSQFHSCAALLLLLSLGCVQARAQSSLLDRLPQPSARDAQRAIATARARGNAGAAELAWLEIFYGTPQERHDVHTQLQNAAQRDPNNAQIAFVQFVLEESEGHERDAMRAALRLLHLAPRDGASELAARSISATLDSQGQALTDGIPEIRQLLQSRLQNPEIVYMLGRPLLAAAGTPGVNLTQDQAVALSGRVRRWTLFGPFGKWANLSFDSEFPVEGSGLETSTALSKGHPFDAVEGMVEFPTDWNQLGGAEYAVSYVSVPVPTTVLLRAYSASSLKLFINGTAVLDNDRRSAYRPATVVGRVRLVKGWNRLLIKLAGHGDREFALVVRPDSGEALTSYARLPENATLAGAPETLELPPTLASWAHAHLQKQWSDPALKQVRNVAVLWADGTRRLQDEDPETGRVELERAAELAPQSAVVWLRLAEAYSLLPDAGPSWAAARAQDAAQHALRADAGALPAYARLAHIAESEAKRTDAVDQYSRCSGKGYADCDWSAFRLYSKEHWAPEAAIALSHAVSEAASDWSGMREALAFYTDIGDGRHALDIEHKMRLNRQAHVDLAHFYLSHGRAKDAVPLLSEAVGQDPSSANIRRDYIRALLDSGDLAQAETAARQALKDFPDEWEIANAAADVSLSSGQPTGVAQLRAAEYNRNSLRHEADFIEHVQFWRPWYHAAEEVIKEAPGKQEYPSASSILVLDQMVDRINPDSSRDSYIHQVFRVLDKAGIELHGDLKLTPGSDLISARTIKQDGTVLLPENVSNLASITMPGLEPGDFVDSEYVMHRPASTVVPQTLENEMFFVFNSSREPFHYSDYIALTPDNYPLLIDEERFPGPAKVAHNNGWTSREWLVRKTRLLGVEPNMPPEQELVPKVWVSGRISWDDISAYFADQAFPARKTTREMDAVAKQVTSAYSTDPDKARALFRWVVQNIQLGQGSVLSPARRYFDDRNGSRLATFIGLLNSAGVPFDVVLARTYTDNSSLKVPSVYGFQYPLIRVSGGGAEAPNGSGGGAGASNPSGGGAGAPNPSGGGAGAPNPSGGGAAAPNPSGGGAGAPNNVAWFDLNNDFAQEDYIAAPVRGALALVTGKSGDLAFTKVPSGRSPLDAVVLSVDANVRPTGDADVKLSLEFRGPAGEQIRDTLNSEPESRLPQIYQQLVLGTYPNAAATGGQILNRGEHQKPLVVQINATVPDFVHSDGDHWEIERIAGPVGVLSRYASLPYREHPLVIGGDSAEETHIRVMLPPRFGSAQLPQGAALQGNFGSFNATYRKNGNEIDFDRSVFLAANVISPEAYPDFRKFGEAIDNEDRLRIDGVTTNTTAGS